MTRLRRGDQRAQNRQQLLEAARAEFLEHGFHGASLDRIAEAAGFSKGAVYSQFGSKAEFFLALLDERIVTRRAENEQLAAEGASPADALARLLRLWARRDVEDHAWTLLVLEFRVHAARDPELRARYAALHERTLDGVERALAPIADSVNDLPLRHVAEVLLALGAGRALELAANPQAMPADSVEALLARMLGAPVESGVSQ